jgi:predicted phage gp36 major capsid-like protein
MTVIIFCVTRFIDHSTGTRMIRDNITLPGYVKMLTTRYVGGGLIDSNAVKVLQKAV